MYTCSKCKRDCAPDEFACYSCYTCIDCGGHTAECAGEPTEPEYPTEDEWDQDYGQGKL